MIPSTTPSTAVTAPVDEDLAEQARPGYGIPSQDPRTGAQTALVPEDAEREAHSALMGGGFLLLVDDAARLVCTSEIPIGILTVSDRASRGQYADLSGPAIVTYLTEIGKSVV